MAAKLDLYREHEAEYVAPREPRLVKVKPARYLAIAGAGGPSDPAFQQAIGALYAMAFTIKMARKFAGQDYKVTSLEGLWWGGEKGKLISDSSPSSWRWKLMIRVPTFVSARERAAAVKKLVERGKDALVTKVKLEALSEGRCVQVLHTGPYTEEGPTIKRMQEVAARNSVKFYGRHHEIYLSDPRRVAAERLRTILRHPVR